MISASQINTLFNSGLTEEDMEQIAISEKESFTTLVIRTLSDDSGLTNEIYDIGLI